MKPNILFLMTDQMRGDCMGIAGHPDVKTPYLDSLAVTGDYFPNAYTACPSCIAARASLMTGLDPRHTGRVGYKDGVAWNYPVTLAGELPTTPSAWARCTSIPCGTIWTLTMWCFMTGTWASTAGRRLPTMRIRLSPTIISTG